MIASEIFRMGSLDSAVAISSQLERSAFPKRQRTSPPKKNGPVQFVSLSPIPSRPKAAWDSRDSWDSFEVLEVTLLLALKLFYPSLFMSRVRIRDAILIEFARSLRHETKKQRNKEAKKQPKTTKTTKTWRKQVGNAGNRLLLCSTAAADAAASAANPRRVKIAAIDEAPDLQE